MNKRIGCLCLVLVFALSMVFAQKLSDYYTDFSIEVFKELNVENGNRPQYEEGNDSYLLQPANIIFNEENEYLYFDPVNNIVNVFDLKFNFKKKIDYKINSYKYNRLSQCYYIACLKDKIILGNTENDDQFLTVYKANTGIVGYYQFEENDNDYYSKNMKILILGDYAFYFKDMGVVEWLERPLTKKELDEKKYLELKRSSLNLEKNFKFKNGKYTYELNNLGVLFINGNVYTERFENIVNFYKNPKLFILEIASYLFYLGEDDDKIMWNYDNNLLVTDKQLNIINIIPLNIVKLKAICIKKEELKYTKCLCYSPENGFTIFAREFTRKPAEGGVQFDYGATYICKIIPKW